MKELTTKQQALWDLKEQGKTRPEIASELGIGNQCVSNTITIIRKKLSLTISKGNGGEMNTTEVQRPEIAAAAIDAASDPTTKTQKEAIDRVNQTLKDAGVPGKVSYALVRRMRVKYADVVTEKKRLTTNEILETIDKEIGLISSYMDDFVCAGANLRDLGLVKTALIEKRNLLKGEPTTIMSDAERKKLNDLLPALIEEGKRRGIIIEGTMVKE
jgi:hypothetical protein